MRLKLSFTHTHIHAHTLTLPPTPSRKALEKACSVRCVPPLPNLLRSQLLPPAPATFFQSSSQHRSVKYSAQGGNRMCCCRYQLPVALTTLTFLVKECWERLHLRAAATAASQPGCRSWEVASRGLQCEARRHRRGQLPLPLSGRSSRMGGETEFCSHTGWLPSWEKGAQSKRAFSFFGEPGVSS